VESYDACNNNNTYLRVLHNGMHYCKATTHKLLYIHIVFIYFRFVIDTYYTQRETLNAHNIIKHTACIRLLVPPIVDV